MEAESPTRALRWALLAGAGLVIAGLFWDAAWHARHPDAFESPRDMLEAHFVIYVGLVVACAAALAALVRALPSRAAFVAALVGGGAAGLGHGLDALAHADGTESSLGHALATLGQLALVIAAVVVSPISLRLPRGPRERR